MNYKADMFRRVNGRSLRPMENMSLNDNDSHTLGLKCMEFSRDSADSERIVDPNLFFVMKDEGGNPILYGSPYRKELYWQEALFVME